MGDRLKLKKPHSDQGKRIAVLPDTAPDAFQQPPKFCLKGMRPGYSVMDCEKQERAAFAERLYELSRLTWSQFVQAPKGGQGFEKISHTAIKGDKVPASISEDVNIIAFRCIGKAPMVGYRTSDGVLNIVWIDRNFTLYDHG